MIELNKETGQVHEDRHPYFSQVRDLVVRELQGVQNDLSAGTLSRFEKLMLDGRFVRLGAGGSLTPQEQREEISAKAAWAAKMLTAGFRLHLRGHGQVDSSILRNAGVITYQQDGVLVPVDPVQISRENLLDALTPKGDASIWCVDSMPGCQCGGMGIAGVHPGLVHGALDGLDAMRSQLVNAFTIDLSITEEDAMGILQTLETSGTFDAGVELPGGLIVRPLHPVRTPEADRSYSFSLDTARTIGVDVSDRDIWLTCFDERVTGGEEISRPQLIETPEGVRYQFYYGNNILPGDTFVHQTGVVVLCDYQNPADRMLAVAVGRLRLHDGERLFPTSAGLVVTLDFSAMDEKARMQILTTLYKLWDQLSYTMFAHADTSGFPTTYRITDQHAVHTIPIPKIGKSTLPWLMRKGLLSQKETQWLRDRGISILEIDL